MFVLANEMIDSMNKLQINLDSLEIKPNFPDALDCALDLLKSTPVGVN